MNISVKIRMNDELKQALVNYPKDLPDLFGDRIIHVMKENSPHDPITPRGSAHRRLKDSWFYEKHGKKKITLNFFNATFQHYYLLEGNLPYKKDYIRPTKAKIMVFRWRRLGYKLVMFKKVRGINPKRPLFDIGKTYDDLIVDSTNEGIELAHRDLQNFLDADGYFPHLEINRTDLPEFARQPGTRRRYIDVKKQESISRRQRDKRIKELGKKPTKETKRRRKGK